jgi:uncharacterized protein YbaR (Trm112 family)/SAM-dependent methyltransferase
LRQKTFYEVKLMLDATLPKTTKREISMNWLKLLACPDCTKPLKLDVFVPGDRIGREGMLVCPGCDSWYPITNGIPRLLVPGPLRNDKAFLTRWKERLKRSRTKALRPKTKISATAAQAVQTQAQVQSVFEFKWKRQADWGIKNQSAQFMENWVMAKYGWNSAADYQRYIQRHRILLDAGCGLGREAIRMAKAHPQGAVVGLELSGCADEAQKHVRDQNLENVLIVQGDLTMPPFRRKSFDFIMSEGVLHHTPDTRISFDRLSRLLSDQGTFAFYIYRKKAALREYADDYIREHLQNVPLEEAWNIMGPLTRLGKTLSEKRVQIDIEEDVPLLGIEKGSYDLQRWIYNAFFKCFWNDAMSFEENVLINFDWYLPRYAWRHTEQEARAWAAKAGMRIEHEYIEAAGITLRAVRT